MNEPGELMLTWMKLINVILSTKKQEQKITFNIMLVI